MPSSTAVRVRGYLAGRRREPSSDGLRGHVDPVRSPRVGERPAGPDAPGPAAGVRRLRTASTAVGPALLVGLLAAPGVTWPTQQPVELWLLLAQTVPLLVRSRWPVAVLCVTTAAAVVQVLVGLPLNNAVLGQAVATATVVSRSPWPASLAAPVGVLTAAVVSSAVRGLPPWGGEVVLTGITAALAWVFGDAVARRHAVREEIEEELAARTERIRLQTRVAAVRERLRIARELHQLVGGGLDAIVVQAGAARLSPGPRTADRITTIEAVGRAILSELDRFLVLLRRGVPALHDAATPATPWAPGDGRWARYPRSTPLRTLLLDGTVAGSMLVLALWDPEIGQTPLTARGAALLAAMTVPLVLRRRHPDVVVAVVVAATATQLLVGMPVNDGMVAVALALHALAARSRRRAVAAGALSVVALVAIFAWSSPGYGVVFGLVVGLGLFVAVALYIGDADRVAASHDALLGRRLAAADDDGRLRVNAAVVDQRAQAARDLHDSIGHTISLIMLLAGAARLSAGTAAESFEVIERSARVALSELDDRLEAADRASPGPAVPTADDLHRLGDNVRAAGTAVALDVGCVDDLPPGVARAVFRIVQEALTNVMKHAAGGAAVVHVDRVDRRVRVRVTSTGGPGARVPLPSGSRGLAGMQERVALFGGHLAAGPDGDTRFVVDARIPVPRSVEEVAP